MANDTPLARRLRVLRAERGLTLTSAAERIGIERKTLSDLEHGKRHPYEPTLAKIARGYGIGVEELIDLDSYDSPKEVAPRSPGRPRTGDLLEEKEIVAWLQDHGHLNRVEFVEWAEGLIEGLDYEERRLALLRGIDVLHELEEYLVDLVRYNRRAQRELFPWVNEENQLRTELARGRLSWKLSNEIRFVYLSRVVEIMNFSKMLAAAGEISAPIDHDERADSRLQALEAHERRRVEEAAGESALGPEV